MGIENVLDSSCFLLSISLSPQAFVNCVHKDMVSVFIPTAPPPLSIPPHSHFSISVFKGWIMGRRT